MVLIRESQGRPSKTENNFMPSEYPKPIYKSIFLLGAVVFCVSFTLSPLIHKFFSYFLDESDQIQWYIFILFLLVFVALLFWRYYEEFLNYVKKVRRAGISHTWLSIFLVAFTLGQLVAIFLHYCYGSLGFVHACMKPLTGLSFIVSLVPWTIFLLLGLLIVFFPSSGDNDFTPRDFAPDSVGPEDDKYNFKEKAKNLAQTIVEFQKPVSVLALQAGMGFGKSSYLRMVIEAEKDNVRIIEPKKNLYTYLSLTETNEAEDLSKLFAKKWTDALSERYSINSGASFLTALEPILRTVEQKSLFGSLFSVVSYFSRIPLYVSRVKFIDKDLVTKIEKRKKVVSELFFDIPSLREEKWIIVIDELERAPLNELMRLVEIIERFKIISCQHLPLQIVFILCFSPEDLKEMLVDKVLYPNISSFPKPNSMEFYGFSTAAKSAELTNNELKNILFNFFFGQKTFTNLEWVPRLKSGYIKNLLKETRFLSFLPAPFSVPLEGVASDRFITDRVDGKKITFLDNETVIATLIALLEKESLRFVDRVLNEIENLYLRVFRENLDLTAFRVGDIFMIEYLKIKYPQAFADLAGAAQKGKIDADWKPSSHFWNSRADGHAYRIVSNFFNPELRTDTAAPYFSNEFPKSFCNPKNLTLYLNGRWPGMEFGDQSQTASSPPPEPALQPTPSSSPHP